jgi:hypothetical protein
MISTLSETIENEREGTLLGMVPITKWKILGWRSSITRRCGRCRCSWLISKASTPEERL